MSVTLKVRLMTSKSMEDKYKELDIDKEIYVTNLHVNARDIQAMYLNDAGFMLVKVFNDWWECMYDLETYNFIKAVI